RLDKIAEIVKPNQIVPTTIKFVDIAGLVAGASKGEGLGNQFLANIRETDAIAHVVRCFEHEDIVHVAGNIDPRKDIEIINTELLPSDLDTVEKAWQKTLKNSKAGDKETIAYKSLLERIKNEMNKGLPARVIQLSNEEKILLKPLNLLTSKPTLYIANVN